MILPVSAIIPTKDRAKVLQRTLESIFSQSHVPAQLIVVDASASDETKAVVEKVKAPAAVSVIHLRANILGAAKQRMQGIDASSQEYILFVDDDVILEDHCLERLFNGFSQSNRVGAVSSMITNQVYRRPGRFHRFMYRLMSGERRESFAGRLIGPAWNMLPEDRSDLPEYVRCEWVNSTCTMYKRDRMPTPVFDDHFTGYSMFEDVTLSVTIGRTYELLNARTARIFHDSQPGFQKDNVSFMATMETVNRHYVMTKVLRRTSVGDHIKFWIFIMYGLLPALRPSVWRMLPGLIVGRIKGAVKIITKS